MARKAHAPIHPGEILLEEFLEPMGLSQYRLARDIGVPPRRINEIVHGKRGITADTALRLARYFGTTERFWMNLQTRFELEREKENLNGRLDKEVPVVAAMRLQEMAGPASVGGLEAGRGRLVAARFARKRAQRGKRRGKDVPKHGDR